MFPHAPTTNLGKQAHRPQLPEIYAADSKVMEVARGTLGIVVAQNYVATGRESRYWVHLYSVN